MHVRKESNEQTNACLQVTPETYVKPGIEVIAVETEGIIAGSPVAGNDFDNGYRYGRE